MYIFIDALITLTLATSFVVYICIIKGKECALKNLDVVIPLALLNFCICAFSSEILLFTSSSFLINWYYFSDCQLKIHAKPFVESAIAIAAFYLIVSLDPLLGLALPVLLLLNLFVSLTIGIGILMMRRESTSKTKESGDSGAVEKAP